MQGGAHGLTPEGERVFHATFQPHVEFLAGHFAGMAPDRQALMEKRKALAEIMRSPNANQSQAMALHREIQLEIGEGAPARVLQEHDRQLR